MYLTLMYDYYGELLTPRQQEIMKLYFFHDLSLGEIAEKLDISRQGVYDHLHRSEDILRTYENKLQLVEKNRELRDFIENFTKEIKTEDLKKETKELVLSRLEELEDLI